MPPGPIARLALPLRLPGHAGKAKDKDEHRRRRQSSHDRIASAPAQRLAGGANRSRRNGFIAQKPAEFIRQFLGRGVAARRLLLEALQADGLEVARQARVRQPGRDRVGVQDLADRGLQTLALKRSAGREQKIENPPRPNTSLGRPTLPRPRLACSGGMKLGEPSTWALKVSDEW
jgi:hypothetical protein